VRVLSRLDELYAIGGGPGANRVGYTPEEDAAHRLAETWLREAGLEVEQDAAGNLIGRLAGEEPNEPEVWTGSHLDSVPQGGRYDGALGVVAGLEAVTRIGRSRRTLGVVAFRDEERGCAGSRALVAGGGLPGFFVELHHEQGPRLAAAGVPLGVVNGIVAYVRGEIVVDGRAGHAGTTPMDVRDDALVAAAREILRIRDAALAIDESVATVGRIEVEPGGINVIPGRARFTVDARAPDDERLLRLIDAIGLDGAADRRVPAVQMRGSARDAVAGAVRELGLPVLDLASGAGHDAGVLATAGVDTAMLFVRALADGVSHAPDEHSDDADVALAVDALELALRRLAA
jgi:acetylornithine deacetylase/succinyl-diaminopimelate desuccinylase-like protein